MFIEMFRVKYFLILVLVVASCFSQECQAREFDGSDKKLKRGQTDKGEILELKKLNALELQIDSIPELTILELNEITKKCVENDWNKALQKAYLLTGRAYKNLNQPQLALYYLEQAEKVNSPKNEELLDKVATKSVKVSSKSYEMKSKSVPEVEALPDEYYIDMAETNSKLERFSTSNSYYNQLKSTTKDSSLSLELEYAIAKNLYDSENFSEALSAYNVLLEKEKKKENQKGIEECNTRIAACYISLGETDKGIDFYSNSLSIEPQNVAESDEELTSNYKSKEVVSNALRKQSKFKEEAEFRNDFNNSENQGLELLKIAQSYFGAENYVQCEQSLANYLKAPDYSILDIEEIDVVRKMANRFEKNGQFEKALNYYRNYDVLRDSINSQLSNIEKKSADLGKSGIQNIIEMEKLQKEKEVSRITISNLMNQRTLKEEIVETQRYLIYLLCLIILIGGLGVVYILRVSKQRRRANQKLALRSLRSQMNPHFIFNALNSVNSFISVSNERDANRFLTEFSTLMRTVMENSETDFIPFSKELEIIKIYLELEHFRFKDKFQYQLNVDPELDTDLYVIPSMLVQPYIENAIWHGLRYKETMGSLTVDVNVVNKGLEIVITDDGIGREESRKLKTKNQRKFKSTALRNIKERMGIFKSLHKLDIELNISDLNESGSGTVVRLMIPQNAND